VRHGTPMLSDEELCGRIRAYWLRVRGGASVSVAVAGGPDVLLPSGALTKSRRIVSNLVAGLPPGVGAWDVPSPHDTTRSR
jgi:hypothetical protein